jgi:hypothetical protein
MHGAAAAPAPLGALSGHLDLVERDRITGWARDASAPDQPVRLRIFDNAVPIAEILADQYREDLAALGIGHGRHSFNWIVPHGLSPLISHFIQVQRADDGAELPNSRRTL